MENLLALVEGAGIIGAGGAGFPTHVKLKAQADTVILNGAECEPLLRVDQQLMASRPGDVLDALDLIVEQTGAAQGVVALKEHYHEAVAALTKELPGHPKARLHLLGAFYPAGDEQVLVYEVTGRIVPEGGIPLNVNVVVSNVETALNVLAAARSQTPVIDKYLTLTGAVRAPKTVKVPLGITVGEALALAGGPVPEKFAVINGGPMMGKVVPVDSLITKTTKGLIVLPADHPLLESLNRSTDRMLHDAKIACMQCSQCTEVCPRNLLGHRIFPHKMMRLAAYGTLADPGYTPMNAYLCCGCRLCEYACVMDLQPWKFNNVTKAALGAQGVRNNLHDAPKAALPFRELKRYPVHKLIRRLGLAEYDVPAPFEAGEHEFAKVTLPLHQGTGAPAQPIVRVGDTVERGAMVAAIPEGKLGSALHASISGTVAQITGAEITIQK